MHSVDESVDEIESIVKSAESLELEEKSRFEEEEGVYKLLIWRTFQNSANFGFIEAKYWQEQNYVYDRAHILSLTTL